MMHFAWPWIFLLLPLPWLVWRFFPSRAQHGGTALYAPAVVERFAALVPEHRPRQRSWLPFLVYWLLWVLLVSAAARPQWLGEAIELPESGRGLMLAIDTSGSMETPDLDIQGSRASRLQVVKQVAGDFIRRRLGDQLGLILFGTQAYQMAPLTFDRMTVAAMLDDSEIGIAGDRTAIGDAIALAVKRLRDLPKGKAALVLLTDGRNTAGRLTPEKGAEIAAEIGLKIYTIAVGADKVRVRDLFGSRTINPSADLDEATLRAIAERTGGRFFRATDRAALEEIYRTIDALEPLEGESQVVHPVTALFCWPLGVALVMSLVLAAAALTGRPGGFFADR